MVPHPIHKISKRKASEVHLKYEAIKYQALTLYIYSFLFTHGVWHQTFDMRPCLETKAKTNNKKKVQIFREIGGGTVWAKDSENLANSLYCHLPGCVISCQTGKWNEIHRDQPKTILLGFEMFYWNMAHLFIHYLFLLWAESSEKTITPDLTSSLWACRKKCPVKASFSRAGKQHAITRAGEWCSFVVLTDLKWQAWVLDS